MEEIRNSNCVDCSLHITCNTVCNMLEPKKCDVLIIAESPSVADDKNETVMRGFDYKCLDGVLEDVIGVDKDRVHQTFLVKCKVHYYLSLIIYTHLNILCHHLLVFHQL